MIRIMVLCMVMVLSTMTVSAKTDDLQVIPPITVYLNTLNLDGPVKSTKELVDNILFYGGYLEQCGFIDHNEFKTEIKKHYNIDIDYYLYQKPFDKGVDIADQIGCDTPRMYNLLYSEDPQVALFLESIVHLDNPNILQDIANSSDNTDPISAIPDDYDLGRVGDVLNLAGYIDHCKMGNTDKIIKDIESIYQVSIKDTIIQREWQKGVAHANATKMCTKHYIKSRINEIFGADPTDPVDIKEKNTLLQWIQ